MIAQRLRSFTTLQWALGLSLVVHAAVLSIRFVDPVVLQQVFNHDALDVVLVNAKSEQDPEEAQALAQHSLAGGGESDDRHLASTPLPPQQDTAEGDASVEQRQQQIDRMMQQQEELIARIRERLAELPRPDPETAKDDAEALALEEKRRRLSDMLAAIERRKNEENSRPRMRYLSPATLGVTYAQYYDDMRLKIEAAGTANFPQFAGRKLYGDLLMALLVNHDGRILDARVVEGSGNRILDRLAEAIAQKAAPFGPFTPAMRRDTDRFDVTARFHFTHDATLQTTLQGDAPVPAAMERDP